MLPPSLQKPSGSVQLSKPSKIAGNRILIYGSGGIGKTSLAASAPGTVVFFDLEETLGKLDLDCPVVNIASWSELRAALQKTWPANVKTIVIDSITVAEELCIKHVLNTIKVKDNGMESKANQLEDYGWGKDVRYVYEAFLPLLADLDKHFKAGRNVILIAHECKPEEVNPEGGNYVRFEPRLRSSKRGENSIRLKVKEWSDAVVFLRYDIVSGKDKKAKGHGTRTAYLSEQSWCMAKNRGTPGPIAIGGVDDLKDFWKELIK